MKAECDSVYYKDGESKVFKKDEEIPTGWKDSPQAKAETKAPPKKRGRPRKEAE